MSTKSSFKSDSGLVVDPTHLGWLFQFHCCSKLSVKLEAISRVKLCVQLIAEQKPHCFNHEIDVIVVERNLWFPIPNNKIL